MKLSSENFKGCGFPEEWLFWITFVAGIAFIISSIFIIIYANKIKNDSLIFSLFGPIYILLKPSLLPKEAQIWPKLFIFTLLMVLLILLLFYFGYDYGLLNCGKIS